MTKRKKDSSGQLTIFDWIQKVEEISKQLSHQQANPSEGSLDIATEFKAALRDDIRHARDQAGMELSNGMVTARMSDLTGKKITGDMLYNWTVPAHPHFFPAIYLPAFVIATGGQRRAFELLSRKSGLFALPGPEALRAEIQRLDEDLKKIQKEKSKRLLYLKEIEKGGQGDE